MNYFIHIPNPGTYPQIDCKGLSDYVSRAFADAGFPVIASHLLLHHSIARTCSVRLVAEADRSGIDEKALAVASVRGLTRQETDTLHYPIYPVTVFVERVLRRARDTDALHATLTRIICHEVCHWFGVGLHSSDRRDVMYADPLPGAWYFGNLTRAVLQVYYRR